MDSTTFFSFVLQLFCDLIIIRKFILLFTFTDLVHLDFEVLRWWLELPPNENDYRVYNVYTKPCIDPYHMFQFDKGNDR